MKIKLDVATLALDTFETSAPAPTVGAGTVLGQSVVPDPSDPCGDTQLTTCNPLEAITCGDCPDTVLGQNATGGNYTCANFCGTGGHSCDVSEYHGCTDHSCWSMTPAYCY